MVLFSLGVEHGLDVGHHVIGVDIWLVELDSFAIGIDEILGEVPRDFSVWQLLLEVFVDAVGIVALNFHLLYNWELSLVFFLHPGLDLLI